MTSILYDTLKLVAIFHFVGARVATCFSCMVLS